MPRHSRPVRGPLAGPALALALAAAAALAPAGLLAQTPAGGEGATLVGTVWDSTSAAPLPSAAVYLLDTPHVTVTDRDGRFVFRGLAAGTYAVSIRHPRLDSLGFAAPPLWRVRVDAGEVARLGLAVPSMATLLPGLCGPSREGGAVVGTVMDASTGTPLPGATVEFVSAAFRSTAEADASGRYVACGLPTGGRLLARATFLSHAPEERWLTLRPGEPTFGAFELRVARGTPVTGRVVDRETGRGVDGALVTVESGDGERRNAFSDADGRFELGRLDLETYIVGVEHLAYGEQSRWFTISDVTPVELELAVAPEALQVEGLTVTVSFPEAERLARSGVRADLVERREIEALLGSARDAGDLVRTLPGVRVRNDLNPRSGQPRLCIEARRAASPGCQAVLVVVDGLVSDPEILSALPPQTIRSIEFIPSVLAGIRYGLRSGNGVLEITTMRGGG